MPVLSGLPSMGAVVDNDREMQRKASCRGPLSLGLVVDNGCETRCKALRRALAVACVPSSIGLVVEDLFFVLTLSETWNF